MAFAHSSVGRTSSSPSPCPRGAGGDSNEKWCASPCCCCACRAAPRGPAPQTQSSSSSPLPLRVEELPVQSRKVCPNMRHATCIHQVCIKVHPAMHAQISAVSLSHLTYLLPPYGVGLTKLRPSRTSNRWRAAAWRSMAPHTSSSNPQPTSTHITGPVLGIIRPLTACISKFMKRP